MGYGLWGRKRVEHDLETKQQQTCGIEKGCFPPSPLNTNPKRIMNTQQAELLISSKRDVHPSHPFFQSYYAHCVSGHMPGPGSPKIMVQFLHLRTCCCCRYVASIMSDSVRPHRQQPTRLLCPWDSPGKNTRVGCHFLLQRMKVKSESEVSQSCPTLSNPMDCSLPGSSIHGIFQTRVLEWGAIAFSAP